MEVHPHVPHEAHKEMFEKHQATWTGITKMMTYSTIAIVVILALMAAFLVHRPVG